MRTATKKRERWEVKWCKSIPPEDRGGIDHAEYVCEYFPTRAAACARAGALIGTDCFGQVRVAREEMRWDMDLHRPEWQETGEPLHVSDPSGTPDEA